MIVIVNYGMGNLRSIHYKLSRFNQDVILSSNISDIEKANKLILPGVGQFSAGMKNIMNMQLQDILNKKIMIDKIPILGICLGMELFSKHSEEGDVDGLGWVQTETIRFNPSRMEKINKIPHMGWNNIIIKKENPLIKNISSDARFYFVHSYHLDYEKIPELVIALTFHGYYFPSIIQQDNIYGVQFHPEKSHFHGMNILKNFMEL
jgi:glutamine amidotransferase